VTDRRPASLSASLIVRKGAASARGFAETPFDVARPAPVRSSPRRTSWLLPFGLGVVLLSGFLTLVWLVFGSGDGGGRHAVIGDVAAVAGPATVEPVTSGVKAAANRGPAVADQERSGPGAPRPTVNAPDATGRETLGASARRDPSGIVPPPRPRSPPGADPVSPSTPAADAPLPSAATASARGSATLGTARAERTDKSLADPGSGGYRVQLHALASDAAVRRAWPRLQKTHGDLLGGLSLVVVRSGKGPPDKTFYRMQVGTLASAAAAKMLCDRLKRRKLDCVIVRP